MYIFVAYIQVITPFSSDFPSIIVEKGIKELNCSPFKTVFISQWYNISPLKCSALYKQEEFCINTVT